MEYLKDVFEKNDTATIDGIELIICTPELSTFNRMVRERLHEWDVQFGISN